MLVIITPEEELIKRRESFDLLKPRLLFSLSAERYFIAVNKIDDATWFVIELNPTNVEYIVNGMSVNHTLLYFDEMRCLNIIES